MITTQDNLAQSKVNLNKSNLTQLYYLVDDFTGVAP